MATKTLDVENMTNRELTRELVKLTDELRARLETCLDMGADSEDALDEGMALAARLERILRRFHFDQDGVMSMSNRLSEAAIQRAT